MKMTDENDVHYKELSLEKYSDMHLKMQGEYNTYSHVISLLTLWEKIVHQFIKLIRKNKLTEFYQICELKQVLNNAIKGVPYWYGNNGQVLSDGFAQNLFYLLKSAHRIYPLLEQTIYNLDAAIVKIQKDPLMLEVIYHSFYKHESLSEYPFSFHLLSQDITIKDVAHFREKILSKIHFYLNDISDTDSEKIDLQYSNWMAFSKIYDVVLLDFLKRFYFHISVETDEYVPSHCTEVTITAVRKYIEKLYLLISSVEMEEEELTVLLVLNASLKEQGSSVALTEVEIREIWEGLKNSILLFKINNNLFNTLCLSYNNPNITIAGSKKIISIKDIFSEILYKRVLGLSDILVKETIGDQIHEVIQELVDSYLIHIDTGIYTVETGDRLIALGSKGFPYIYLISLMKHLIDHLNNWVISFLKLSVINVHFCQFSDFESVNQFLKKIGVFGTSFFNKFMQQIATDSIISMRILKLINKNKLVENELHLLNVFVDAINTQSDILIEEFKPIHNTINKIAQGFYNDIINDSNNYILDSTPVKQIGGDNIELRLKKILDLCQKITIILNLTTQSKNILSEVNNDE